MLSHLTGRPCSLSISASHRIISGAAVAVLGSQRRQGRSKRAANFAVQSVPGSSSPRLGTRKITVASEQNTFHSVRRDRLTSGESKLVPYGVG
jgi:hypothetical protein